MIRFAAFSAFLFVFVFAVTWYALAQTGDGAQTPQDPAATPDVDVNLDILDTLRDPRESSSPDAGTPIDDGLAELPLETTPEPVAELPRANVAPSLPLPPPPLPKDQADNLPPPIVPSVPVQAAQPDTSPGGTEIGKTRVAAVDFKDRELRLLFDADSPALTFEAAEELTSLARQLVDNSVRLELHAYAGDSGNSSSDSHRLAFKRALAVRGYLVEQAIDASRIDLHAEGPAPDSEPPDRVDIRFKVQ